jgi:hypothetical protein
MSSHIVVVVLRQFVLEKEKDDSWRITSVVQPHTWFINVDNRRHAQLSSRFI